MDRPLDPAFVRRLWTRRIGLGVLTAALLAAAFLALTAWIRPSVAESRIRTAVVEEGPLEATISASGTVVPGFEQVIASPIDGRILQIHQQPGAPLQQGAPIVALDVEASREVLETLNDQLALNENRQKQTRLERDGKLIDLEGQGAIKRLEVETLERTLVEQQKLFGENLITREALRQAEQDVERARIQLQQLADTKANTEQVYAAQLENLALEANIERRDRDAARRGVDQAVARADRDGVLTWVVPEVGPLVRRGDVLARVADLSTFRVEATVADAFAGQLAVGQPVRIQIDTVELQGTVSRVRPTVQNGMLTVDVRLEEPAHERLRSNLRVDVYIVAANRSRATRLSRGPAVNSPGHHEVFVLRGTEAFKRSVTVGLTSLGYVEITDGLEPGDEVIISDMADYLHLDKVRIR